MNKCICYPFDTRKYKIKIAKPVGRYAHENFPEFEYAIDFILDEGTPVLAVHEGTVIKVKSDSERYFGLKNIADLEISEIRKLAEKYTNYVCIDHKDGTFAEYLHLRNDITVKEGKNVKQGELIGYIGLSGIITTPHLHFNIFKFIDGKARSIRVKFK